MGLRDTHLAPNTVGGCWWFWWMLKSTSTKTTRPVQTARMSLYLQPLLNLQRGKGFNFFRRIVTLLQSTDGLFKTILIKHNNYWHNENFNHGFYKLLLFTHTKYFIFLLLSPETNKKIMAGILSYEPAFDRKIAENSSQSLKRDRRLSFPASKWTKIVGTLVCI